ncbi:hypothetical protein K469DRAFT_801849 [Zopfia rhizophila CBS 207.26]|uniref:Uncharacterized protein n=1 Tax=Zopfia rhizophila CBS 207.26 TaxID=1314779 RepID=A0A6A6DME7_9PEZI|nr:hypothetical protein K469DRAFT_801849 [Zopfia rhizophila CBS 207.26]
MPGRSGGKGGKQAAQSHREALTVRRVGSIPPSTANVTSGEESVKVEEGAGQREGEKCVVRGFVADRNLEVNSPASFSVCEGCNPQSVQGRDDRGDRATKGEWGAIARQSDSSEELLGLREMPHER